MIRIKLPLQIKTARLILRPLQLADYENWSQAYASFRAPRSEWDEGPWKDSALTRAEYKKWLKAHEQQARRDQLYSFGVFRRDDGVLLGLVQLMDISRGIFQNAYLGYRIFNNYWGQGYATEACAGVLKLAFKNLFLHRVEAGISPKNKGSLKVARKIGLRRESLSRKRLFVNGKWQDLVLYAATCEDFGLTFRKKVFL